MTTIEDFADATFDPYHMVAMVAGQARVADIHTDLRRLRLENPVVELDPRVHFGTQPDQLLAHMKKWAVLGYAEAAQVLASPGVFSNRIMEQTLDQMFGPQINAMDAPEHRKYRAVFQAGFMPDMLENYRRDVVEGILTDLIDGFADRGHADLIAEFTKLFPFSFIAELLGLPKASRATFQKLSFAQSIMRYDAPHALEAGEKMARFLSEVVAERRGSRPIPGDFVYELATAEIDGEQLPDHLLISFIRLLMHAAGDTSFSGLSNLLAGLLTNPDQLQAVRADRALIGPAIEEALRWEAPQVFVERIVLQETILADVTLRPGELVYVALAAANRDERVFENPNAFDIRRKPQRHLAFGYGSHLCIGQHLARMEMAAALDTLLDRLPKLRLDPAGSSPVVVGVTNRRPESLRVVFT